MRLSAKQLNDLRTDPGFVRLPGELGVLQPFTHWTEVSRLVSQEAARAGAWLACHKLAELFEVYPETLQQVRVEYDNGHDDFPLLCPTFYINGVRARKTWMGNRHIPVSAELDAFKAVDGGKQLDAITDWLDEVGRKDSGHTLSVHITKINTWLKAPITSAREARQLAQSIAPEVDAWVKKHLLEQALADSPTLDEPENKGGLRM